MARIVLSTLGSLGDLHPMLALGLELRRRGHQAVINSLEGYRETASGLGLDFAPLRPEVDESDKALIRRLVDDRTGPETVIRELVMPNLSDTYNDLSSACKSADVMITGELIYVAASLAEKTGIKWVSTSLSPITLFSAEDPSVYPGYPWMEYFRPLPAFLHRASLDIARMAISHWLKPFKEFRRGLGLDPNVDPMFVDKYSSTLHLAMFSKALARPQTDWPSTTLQTGFCYYDESETTVVDGELEHFLNEGEAPIVFTLGSAAVLDAGDFFEVSAAAAKRLGKRAVLLYGRDQPRPAALNGEIAAFEFAPYSRVFSKASCVVHQGGVGTTGQALKAGVPQLIVPFSHDQPDNAARCRRAGVAEIVERRNFAIGTAHNALLPLLEKPGYRERASELKGIVDSEAGTKAACDAIEEILSI